MCHKWSPEETRTDQKTKPALEVSGHPDYYNVIPGKTPPSGGIEDLRMTKEKRQDPEIQGVRVGGNNET